MYVQCTYRIRIKTKQAPMIMIEKKKITHRAYMNDRNLPRITVRKLSSFIIILQQSIGCLTFLYRVTLRNHRFVCHYLFLPICDLYQSMSEKRK